MWLFHIVHCLVLQGEYKAQKEAVWAITNLTAGGNLQQIVYVIQAGAIKPLCDLLVVKETKIVTVILDAILNILQVSYNVDRTRGLISPSPPPSSPLPLHLPL